MNIVKREPVLAIAALIAAVLTVVGVKVDASTLADFIFAGVPVIGGLLARAHVTPNIKIPAVVTEVVDDVAAVADAAVPVVHLQDEADVVEAVAESPVVVVNDTPEA